MKQFLFLMGLLIAISAFAQQGQNYAHQLALVDSLRAFLVTEVKLDVGKDFYTRWSESKDSMYVYLYVSQSDRIKIPDEVAGHEVWYFESEAKAIAKSDELKDKGYETLVYKTAGMSDARLSPKLLSYPDEAIAFIICHEATHRYVRKDKNTQIPYICEEALCDAVANAACTRFAQKTKMLDIKCVLSQKKIFENLYAFMNDARIDIDSSELKDHPLLLKACNTKIWRVADKGNQFVKDRMQYQVNNAYFIRIAPYSLHYFEEQKMLGAAIDIDHAIAAILAKFGTGADTEKKPDAQKPAEILTAPKPGH